MFFRGFINEFKESMQKGYVATKEITFKLRIGYRLEKEHKSITEMLDGWMPVGKKEVEVKLSNSFATTHLNMIY